MFVSSSATLERACDIIVDAKVYYLSACNAMETLLLHKDTLQNGVAMKIMMSLCSAGVKYLGGSKAMKNLDYVI